MSSLAKLAASSLETPSRPQSVLFRGISHHHCEGQANDPRRNTQVQERFPPCGQGNKGNNEGYKESAHAGAIGHYGHCRATLTDKPRVNRRVYRQERPECQPQCNEGKRRKELPEIFDEAQSNKAAAKNEHAAQYRFSWSESINDIAYKGSEYALLHPLKGERDGGHTRLPFKFLKDFSKEGRESVEEHAGGVEEDAEPGHRHPPPVEEAVGVDQDR